MISSVSNQSVKEVKQLIKNSSYRKSEGLFVAEGSRLVKDIIASEVFPEKLFMTEEFLESEDGQDYKDKEKIMVSSSVMKSISDTKTPQGIMGVFRIPRYESKDLFIKENPLLLILEDIRDPGNMGTIFRTFEAAGGDGIILLKNCTDIFSPKCIRSTMGSGVRLPFISVNDFDLLKDVLKNKVTVYAADMNGNDYLKMDYKKACAFIIGNEAKGLSKEAISFATDTVSIGMKGKVESLNAAISASILSYEAKRQREW